jgi:hypothetical protein
MDYKEIVQRIDEMQMSPRDRAAAKLQLAHAERFVDWALAAAGSVRGASGTLFAALRPPARARGSFQRTRAA